jgi:hypothetical protein
LNKHRIRLFRIALVCGLVLLLWGCCDDVKQELEQTKLDLLACETERDDWKEKNDQCVAQLNLVSSGAVLSYECKAPAPQPISTFDAANAQYTLACSGESSVTVTEGSMIVPEGMAIALPGGGGVTFPGGGGVLFPGGGGVVFPGGGGVTFPGGGGVVFAPGDGGADTDTNVGAAGELVAYDKYEITGVIINGDDPTDPDNGFFLLPGGKSRLRCVQQGVSNNERILSVTHDTIAHEYTFACLDQGGNPASSILITNF